MKAVYLILGISFAAFNPSRGDKTDVLVVIGFGLPTEPPSGRITEYKAAKQDVEAVWRWRPAIDAESPVPLKGIIAAARNWIQIPARKGGWDAPEFRGANLRLFSADIWVWEVFFALGPAPPAPGEFPVRDGEIVISAKVLPNGGRVHVVEREMTAEERAIHGVSQKSK